MNADVLVYDHACAVNRLERIHHLEKIVACFVRRLEAAGMVTSVGRIDLMVTAPDLVYYEDGFRNVIVKVR